MRQPSLHRTSRTSIVQFCEHQQEHYYQKQRIDKIDRSGAWQDGNGTAAYFELQMVEGHAQIAIGRALSSAARPLAEKAAPDG
jgi:hypothetical protein